MLKIVSAVVAILAISGVGTWKYFEYTLYNSEPEQLKRGCVDATWEQLVAPATAKLVEFRIFATGTHSILGDQYQARVTKALEDVETAQKTLGKAQAFTSKESLQKINTLGDEATKRLDAQARRGEITQESALRQELDLHMQGMELITNALKADAEAQRQVQASKKEADAASQEKANYDAKGLAEIVLSFDAQNRASALLRMQSVCTYKADVDLKKELSSLRVAKIDERGQ